MATTTDHREWSALLATAARYRQAANRHRRKAADWEAKAKQLEGKAGAIRARHAEEKVAAS